MTKKPDATKLNLLGKDYFTRVEAAHYWGASVNVFVEQAQAAGIYPVMRGRFPLYRKADLQNYLEGLFLSQQSSLSVAKRASHGN